MNLSGPKTIVEQPFGGDTVIRTVDDAQELAAQPVEDATPEGEEEN